MECTDSLLHVLYYVHIIQWLVTNNIIVMCMCQNKSISHVQYYTAWSEYITPNDSNSCWSISLFCVIVVYLLEFKPCMTIFKSFVRHFLTPKHYFYIFLALFCFYCFLILLVSISVSFCLSVCLLSSISVFFL